MNRYFVPAVILGLTVVSFEQPALTQPAPALSSVRVVSVQSPLGGLDQNIGQFSTSRDHGGNTLTVVTEDVGYGQNQIALFNGTRMTRIGSQPLVNPVTRIVTGFRYTWSYTGSFSSGTFTYQSTSINAPIRTLSLRLSIR